MANPQANTYAQQLAQQGMSLSQASVAVAQQFPGLSAQDMATALSGAYNLTVNDAPALAQALLAAQYTPDNAAAGLKAVFSTIAARPLTAALVTAYGPLYAVASLGYALALSGNNNYVAMPTNAAYNLGQGDFSVAAWIRPRAAGQIVSRKPTPGGAGNGGWLFVLNSDSTLKLATDDGFGYYQIITSPTNVMDGNWHYVAAVRQAGKLFAYQDGRQLNATVGTNRDQSPLDVNNSLRLLIGYTDQQQDPSQFFTGSLTHVELWKVARSGADIATSMFYGINAADPGLVGYWTFAGQSAQDLSPVANNGAFTGAVTFSAPNYLPASLPLGLALDVVSTPINVAHKDVYNVGTGDFSIEAWFNTTAGGALLSYGQAASASDTGFALIVDATQGQARFLLAGGGQAASAAAATTACDGKWHYLVATRSGNTLALFLDGQSLASTAQGNPAAVNISSSAALIFGGSAGQGNSFMGAINGLNLWSRALSPGDIQSSRVQYISQSAQNLVGSWIFRSDGVKDRSSNANHSSYADNVSLIAPPQLPGAPIANESLWLDPATNGVASIPLASPLTLNDLTVEAWVNTAEAGSGATVVNCDGALSFAVVDGAIVFEGVKGADSCEWKAYVQAVDGHWHHIAAVRRKDVVQIYLDGNPANTLSAGRVSGTLTCANSITVGGLQPTNSSNRYAGLIDELRIWNAARSTQDIQRTMHTTIDPQGEPTLIRYYNFDDGTGQELTGSGDNMKLYGSAMIIQADCPLTFAPPPLYPPPGNLSASYTVSGSTGQLVLSWQAVNAAGVTGYTVELQAGDTVPESQTTGSTSYTFAKLLDTNTPYIVRVKANGTGLGNWTDPLAIIAAAPANVVTHTPQLNALTVNWQSNSIADAAYIVELQPGQGSVVDRSTPVGATSYAFTDLTLNPTLTYTIRVRAQRNTVTGPWSAITPVIVLAPTGITTDAQALNQFRVSWTATSLSNAAYNVLLTPASGQAVTRLTAVGATSYTFTDYTLDPHLTYNVQVQAVVGDNTGPWSNQVPVLALIPTQLMVEVVLVATKPRFKVSWQPVQDASATYLVELQPRTGAATQVSTAANASSYVFQAIDLAAGMTYSVRVRASVGQAIGVWTDPLMAPLLRTATYTYDLLGRLTDVVYDNFATYRYSYDNAGNITQIVEQ